MHMVIIRRSLPVMRRLGAIFLMWLLINTPTAIVAKDELQLKAYLETFPIGRIDWKDGIIYGIGRGYLDLNKGSKDGALRAAQVISAGNILKLAAGMRVDDQRFLKSLGGGRVVIELKAHLKLTKVETKFISEGPRPYYQVTQKTPLTGVSGLTSNLLKQLKQRPSEWKEFPQSTTPQVTGEGQAPWLVLDARKLPVGEKAQPALFPKIVSETGQTVYEISKVDEAALQKNGMAKYTISDDKISALLPPNVENSITLTQLLAVLNTKEALAQDPKRRKRRAQYIVKDVKAAQGLLKTNLVISAQDAQHILAEDSSNKVLKNCRVIVILSSPIGGIEGKEPNHSTVPCPS
jgi:hypothetical protein